MPWASGNDVTSAALNWRNGNEINILDPAYSADSSGVADSAGTIQAAITALPANGGVVYIPPGVYRIDSQLTIDTGTVLCGAGQNTSILSFNGGAGEWCIATSGDVDNIAISGLRILGNSTASGGILLGEAVAGITPAFYSLNDIAIRRFSATSAIGLRIDNASSLVANNVAVTALSPSAADALHIYSSNINTGVFSFNGCTFGDGSTRIGLLIDAPSNAVDGISFQGSYVGGVQQVAQIVNCRSLTFSGCHFEATGDDFFVVTAWLGGGIWGSTFGGDGTNNYAVRFVDGSAIRAVRFEGNELNNLNASGSGIRIDSGAVLSGLVIGKHHTQINAVSTLSDPAGLFVTSFSDEDGTPSVYGGNHFDGSPDVFKTANTSATTITMFDNPTEGQQITVLFGDSLTSIAHSTTSIMLNRGVPFVAAENDRISLQYMGGLWYEISRTTA